MNPMKGIKEDLLRPAMTSSAPDWLSEFGNSNTGEDLQEKPVIETNEVGSVDQIDGCHDLLPPEDGKNEFIPVHSNQSSKADSVPISDNPELDLRSAYDLPRPDGFWNNCSYLSAADFAYLTAPVRDVLPFIPESHQPRFTFGIHKGKLVHEVDSKYLRQMLKMHREEKFHVVSKIRNEIIRVLTERRLSQ